jgi:hypothetical protein
MRTRLVWWIALLLAGAIGGAATFSLTSGQGPPPPPEFPATPAAPLPGEPKPLPPSVITPVAATQPTDLSRLPLLTRQMTISAQRGAEWLHRMNLANGRFVFGCLPALNKPMEGDHFLSQAGAAFALARAARFTGDERYTVRARQAVLSLLAETQTDPADPAGRCTVHPSVVVNRLGAAGLLVAAINELPAPASELLDQGEQLCHFIRRQQRPDGSLACGDNPAEPDPTAGDPECVNTYPGLALYGLALSQRYRPAPWKDECVRKALPYYRAWWKAHPSLTFVPWQTAACTEAFLRTKEGPFAEFVFEMNDWLCEFQYTQPEPQHPFWRGGFQGCRDGRPQPTPPGVDTACSAEALAEACRVARQLPDVQRFDRYRAALTHSLQFLTTVQYAEENTQHFAATYRTILLGGFHNSHQDGNLRVDATQHAVCALVQYLTYTAERP